MKTGFLCCAPGTAAVAAFLGISGVAWGQIGNGEQQAAFDYFSNSWNVIGLKDYPEGTRVSPENELLLADKAKARILFGKDLTALSRQQTKTLSGGWMPILLLSAQEGEVSYEFALWSTPLPTVKDWARAFDWPAEGENYLNWIQVKATNRGTRQAEAQMAVEVRGPSRSEDEKFRWSLGEGESATAAVRIPFQRLDRSTLDKEDPQVWLKRTAAFWTGLLAKGAQIEVPCRKAADTLKAAHVCQFIANDQGEIHAGEGFYDEFYIRDGAYQLLELEEGGFDEAARKGVEVFLKYQKPDGHFESQKNQLDANGQALWTLWQYGKITGDRTWLERAYPQMVKASEWVKKTRREAAADSPFAGLLPAAVADGEFLWEGKSHIVGYDLWNLRGLLCTADVARTLGKANEAKALATEADAYRQAIDAAVKRAGLDYFPPSWEKAGTFWGNTETLWPTELFAVADKRVEQTINQARKVLGGGFTEGTIHWIGGKEGEPAIHPYLSAYTTMASLARGDSAQVVEDFYWYLLHSTAGHAFPEGIHYQRQFAWGDTIPHATGASNYAFILRHMLLHESKNELHVLAAVPDWWLEVGKEIRIANAPTHFGPVSLVVRGKAEGVEVDLKKPAREPPSRIVVHLPESRRLLKAPEGLEAVYRPAQKDRWDFEAVVRKYRGGEGR